MATTKKKTTPKKSSASVKKSQKERPIILITNDDGVTAPGIQNLVEAVKDLGKIVVGIEGNYDMIDLNLNGGAVVVDNVVRLKLIGGYDLGPALLYATVAAVRADSSIGSDNGTAMGIGVDYALTGRVTVGAELLEHRFKDFAASGINLDATTANLRVGFRF